MDVRNPRTRFALIAVAALAVVSITSLPARADFFGVAHRGGRVQGPENTLEVFQLTIDLGVTPWLETDSWLTSDGVPVLHHDLDLCRTTNIDSLPGYDCSNPVNNPLGRFPRIADFTLAELKTLDVGSWFAPEFAGTTMPTLEEALQLVDGTGVPLLVDVKRPGQAPIIAEILNRTGISSDNIIIWARQSFAWDEYHGVIPGIRQMTGALQLSAVTDQLLATRAAAGDLGIAIQAVGLTQNLMDQIHSYGLLTYSVPTATGRDPIRDQIEVGIEAYHVSNELEWETFLSGNPCLDRVDNDGDGFADFDGIDFDFDGVPDVLPDPACTTRLAETEVGECQDLIDNDGDGFVDLADRSCRGPESLSEAAPVTEVPFLSVPGIVVFGLSILGVASAGIRRASSAGRARPGSGS